MSDARIVGAAVGGSFAAATMDEFSDLDVLLAVEPAAYPDVLRGRQAIAASLGTLLACYTAEHLGEPQLLICLFDDPLLLVDLNFLSLSSLLTARKIRTFFGIVNSGWRRRLLRWTATFPRRITIGSRAGSGCGCTSLDSRSAVANCSRRSTSCHSCA
jgi:hypothetical protein